MAARAMDANGTARSQAFVGNPLWSSSDPPLVDGVMRPSAGKRRLGMPPEIAHSASDLCGGV